MCWQGWSASSRTISFEIAVYAAVGGLVAIWTLGDAEHLNRFFVAGAYVALADSLVILTFRAPGGTLDTVGLLTLARRRY